MNRSLALSLFLGIAIIAGILLLFPSLWTLLLLLLLGLVSGLVVLVRRHLTVHRVLTPDTPWPGSRAATGEAGPTAAAAAPPREASADTAEAPGEGRLDSHLFSRFRARLEEAEAPSAQPGAPAPDYDSPEGVTDRVNLSSTARRTEQAPPRPSTKAPDRTSAAATPAGPPQPTAQPPPTDPQSDLPDEAVEVDIFDDLRTDPAAIVATKPRSAATAPAPPPLPANEQLDVPAEPSAGTSTAEDGPALLHMAEDALTRGDLAGARAGLNNYFAAMGGHETEVAWQAHLAQLRLSIADGKPETVPEHFEEMLGRGFAPAQETMADTFDAWLSPLAEEDAAPLRVSLLVRALAYFRQAGDREAMDGTYRLIATAQEATGDEHKLVQFLKNHLEIKKVMGDQAGQLDLIDQIGNRLYRLGETEEARIFYEQGLTLRAQLEGGAAPEAADAETSPPAPPEEASKEDSPSGGEEPAEPSPGPRTDLPPRSTES